MFYVFLIIISMLCLENILNQIKDTWEKLEFVLKKLRSDCNKAQLLVIEVCSILEPW